MHPFFFGPASDPLFGVYQAPSKASNTGVLLCGATGHEYMRSHWALRQLAMQLVESGHHVLRFDYFGTGDSAGDFADGSSALWLDNVALAASELINMGNLRTLGVVGLRWGATLAYHAPFEHDVARMVMWDPICSGREYMRDLERLHRGAMRDPFRFPDREPSTRDQFVGYEYPRELRESFAALTIEPPAPQRLGSLLIVTSSEDRRARGLSRTMVEAGHRCRYRCIPDGGYWNKPGFVEEALLAPHIVRAITAELGG